MLRIVLLILCATSLNGSPQLNNNVAFGRNPVITMKENIPRGDCNNICTQLKYELDDTRLQLTQCKLQVSMLSVTVSNTSNELRRRKHGEDELSSSLDMAHQRQAQLVNKLAQTERAANALRAGQQEQHDRELGLCREQTRKAQDNEAATKQMLTEKLRQCEQQVKTQHITVVNPPYSAVLGGNQGSVQGNEERLQRGQQLNPIPVSNNAGRQRPVLQHSQSSNPQIQPSSWNSNAPAFQRNQNSRPVLNSNRPETQGTLLPRRTHVSPGQGLSRPNAQAFGF